MSKNNHSDYFLEPQIHSDSNKYRGPIRTLTNFKPLIDGDTIFRKFEHAILKAKKHVLIAFWQLDPGTKTLTNLAKKKGFITWGDLIVGMAKRGVKIRVMVSDFDPIIQHGIHLKVWNNYRNFVTVIKNKSIKKEFFQMIVVKHEFNLEVKGVLGVLITLKVNTLMDFLNKLLPIKKRIIIFKKSPGLWTLFDPLFKTGTFKLKSLKSTHNLLPGSFHQKIILVDGKKAFVGGLNIMPLYLDSQKHRKKKMPWHDLFIQFEGDLLIDILRNYIGMWNKERKSFNDFLKEANKELLTLNPKASNFLKFKPGLNNELVEKEFPLVPPNKKGRSIRAQVHRTISVHSKKRVPRVVREDIHKGYLKSINMASKYIYIENQYFRSMEIAEAIVNRFKKVKTLRVIIVLPGKAEELLNKKPEDIDIITKHGAHLQFEALQFMEKEMGPNIGLFSLVRGPKKDMVYVHSKLLLIDDIFGSVGSANLNPRSFKMDTELNVVWHDKRTVRDLRLKLWLEMIGKQSGMKRWKPDLFVKKWTKIAKKNNTASGVKRRKGFIIPFLNTFKGEKSAVVPDVFATFTPPSDSTNYTV